MATALHLGWLRARDAKRVAAVERRIHTRRQCAGREHIHEDLAAAEWEGANLSMGLFAGRRLVGYMLVYKEQSCQDICRYLGISVPRGVSLEGPGLFLSDFGVLRSYRSAAGMLATRLAALLQRPDLAGLPVVIFCEPEMRSHWLSKEKLLARHGYELSEEAPIPGPAGGQLHLLVFRQILQARCEEKPSRPLRRLLRNPATLATADGELTVGLVHTMAGWELLQPVWNDLLERTPACTVFQTYEYLQCWWRHIGALDDLRLFVCMRGDEVVGIAPMYTSTVFWLGQPLRCLLFIGQPSESDRPTLLADAGQPGIAEAVATYVVDNRTLWDRLVLFEQPDTTPFFVAMRRQLEAAGMLVSVTGIPVCAYVEIDGNWKDYLATRSKSFRKNISRRNSQLGRVGEVRYESRVHRPGDPADVLAEYVDVERNSWKLGEGLGVSQSSSHLSFYRALAGALGDGVAVEFKLLRLDGQPIAATFGLDWRDCFYSLHITHDSRFNEHSPGLVLTAMELQEAFDQRKYRLFDFLGGFLTNKMSWATGGVETVALFAHRPGPRSWLYHWIAFSARPRLRRWLIRHDLLKRFVTLRQKVTTVIDQWNLWR